ncbi:MAG TPA: amylo-alpha-1,6-glucosidase [Candidatus Acidoferrales bacterium]|nr:amylo-alpha-1,6-glucosidase [Candidatus Acidoferrales bacterium]
MTSPIVVKMGPEICGSVEVGSEREWLVTNGLGGFACGTVTGVLTRRYHGLLIAPLGDRGRVLLVSKAEEVMRYAGGEYALGANRWSSGAIEPQGFRFIERFYLAGSIPVWRFACGDAILEKRVWMQEGANTTFVRYELLYGSEPAELEVKVLVNCRDMHATTQAGDWNTSVSVVDRGLRVVAREGAPPVYLLSDIAQAEAGGEWYRNYDLPVERERGLDDQDDHFFAGSFKARLSAGEAVTFAFGTEQEPPLEKRAALEMREEQDQKLFEYWIAAHPRAALEAPHWIWQLVLAAAQFTVRCRASKGRERWGIIAGYPWFGEWGRDSMIALPGLALETGRPEIARSILQEYAGFTQEGLLPNTFLESGQAGAYNSVDSMLWYFQALQAYVTQTSDLKLVRSVFDALASAVDRYARGTQFGIHADSADGLLYAGQAGVQITWMDAKAGEHVITPRIGKAVEVNALWFNALLAMARFAPELGKPAGDYKRLAERARRSFARFWNQERQCCFDVIDGPSGNDASLRPNQIFAVSLGESPLDAGQQKRIVETCALHLWTPHGLRSLDDEDPNYRGSYGGPQTQRDGAYHQGTVWSWLLGPFVIAHLRVYQDPARAFAFLEPMEQHLSAAAGLGSISEIFDGDPPCAARGTFAQAWSVAEVLRAWRACYDAGLRVKKPAAG